MLALLMLLHVLHLEHLQRLLQQGRRINRKTMARRTEPLGDLESVQLSLLARPQSLLMLMLMQMLMQMLQKQLVLPKDRQLRSDVKWRAEQPLRGFRLQLLRSLRLQPQQVRLRQPPRTLLPQVMMLQLPLLLL